MVYLANSNEAIPPQDSNESVASLEKKIADCRRSLQEAEDGYKSFIEFEEGWTDDPSSLSFQIELYQNGINGLKSEIMQLEARLILERESNRIKSEGDIRAS